MTIARELAAKRPLARARHRCSRAGSMTRPRRGCLAPPAARRTAPSPPSRSRAGAEPLAVDVLLTERRCARSAAHRSSTSVSPGSRAGSAIRSAGESRRGRADSQTHDPPDPTPPGEAPLSRPARRPNRKAPPSAARCRAWVMTRASPRWTGHREGRKAARGFPRSACRRAAARARRGRRRTDSSTRMFRRLPRNTRWTSKPGQCLGMHGSMRSPSGSGTMPRMC